MNPKLTHTEQALEPDLCIVDTHHHLWDAAGRGLSTYYTTDELLTDLHGGHNVVKTVFMECDSHYRESGPVELRPLGETEWVASQDVPAGVMAGIVGFADVRRDDIGDLLAAHGEKAGSRFKGVRYSAAWDPAPDVISTARDAPPGTLVRPEFVRGVRAVGEAGKLFETWVYFHQLGDVVELARAAEGTTIILDHLGGPAGTGPYADHREETLEKWRNAMSKVASEPNVIVKVGGIGFGPFIEPSVADTLTTSADIAEYWGAEVRFAIDTFGPERSMLETNYPVDSALADYITLWNAYKRMTDSFSSTERAAVFAETAERVYGI